MRSPGESKGDIIFVLRATAAVLPEVHFMLTLQARVQVITCAPWLSPLPSPLFQLCACSAAHSDLPHHLCATVGSMALGPPSSTSFTLLFPRIRHTRIAQIRPLPSHAIALNQQSPAPPSLNALHVQSMCNAHSIHTQGQWHGLWGVWLCVNQHVPIGGGAKADAI